MLDRNKYTESAYIGEELFGDLERERLHKCIVVAETIADGDFSLEEALDAYQVDKEEYEEFVAKKSNFNIRASISGTTSANCARSLLQIPPTKVETTKKNHLHLLYKTPHPQISARRPVYPARCE